MRIKGVVVAVYRDGNAFHQFHYKKRSSGIGCAGVEHFGDVGVIHHGQGLTLRLKAGHDLLGVHPEFDDLQSNPTADGLFLFGEIDGAHATLADDFEDAVGAYAFGRTLKV